MTDPRPSPPLVAVARARMLLAHPSNASCTYQLGGGDYNGGSFDLPWTYVDGGYGSDCMGLIAWAFELPRHREGYNRGSWATVSDDINSNSAIEDADHARDLFVRVDGAPLPGDVIAYPTIRLDGKTFIGHIALVVGVTGWDGTFGSLGIIEICGPNGRTPAAIAANGSVFDRHSLTWPKPEHRSVLLRSVA